MMNVHLKMIALCVVLTQLIMNSMGSEPDYDPDLSTLKKQLGTGHVKRMASSYLSKANVVTPEPVVPTQPVIMLELTAIMAEEPEIIEEAEEYFLELPPKIVIKKPALTVIINPAIFPKIEWTNIVLDPLFLTGLPESGIEGFYQRNPDKAQRGVRFLASIIRTKYDGMFSSMSPFIRDLQHMTSGQEFDQNNIQSLLLAMSIKDGSYEIQVENDWIDLPIQDILTAFYRHFTADYLITRVFEELNKELNRPILGPLFMDLCQDFGKLKWFQTIWQYHSGVTSLKDKRVVIDFLKVIGALKEVG